MSRPKLRARRPSVGNLSVMLAVVGVAAGLSFLFVPVEAAFGDDPLLRLQPFSPVLDGVATEVECGVPVSNLGRRSDGLSLYGLARDDACRAAASRRVASAVATAAVIGLLALIGLTGARPREAVG